MRHEAQRYYSDAFPAYETLYYGAPFELPNDKKETYSVEAVNAVLRHYLKRLARKSRCFSRYSHLRRCALKIFVYCFNQRQIRKRVYPSKECSLSDFLV
jgi:IS1 family transposase